MFVFTFTFVVLICSNMAKSFKLEQSCSRFHYEEQTLEKIVRLQIFVEKIKEEVDSTQSKVLEELKTLTKERERFHEEIRDMKDALDATKAGIENELMTTKNYHLEAIKQFAEDVAKIKESSMVSPVAFQSHKVADTAMTDNKVLIFTTDMINYEASYNNQTGTFTVPKGGIYMFSVQISVLPTHWANYGIYVNEAFIQHGLIAEKVYQSVYTLVAVADVAKGDRVTVRCISSCSGDNLYESSHTSSSFSGVLIHGK